MPKTISSNALSSEYGPTFFMVGAPKCGTTAMSAYLNAHPEIFIPEKKELFFFGSDFTVWPAPTTAEYEELFLPGKSCRHRGDATVFYLYSANAAAEIHEAYPNAYIIIMLRNPVEMIPSLHSQFLYTGHEDIKELDQALAAEDERRAGKLLPQTVYSEALRRCPKMLFYRDLADFPPQLERYYSLFPKAQIHTILYDDFKRNTEKCYFDVLQFLGVDTGFVPDFPIINANKRKRSAAISWLIYRRPDWLAGIARRILPSPLHRAIYKSLVSMNTHFRMREPISEELKRRLHETFFPTYPSIEKITGCNLNEWKSSGR